MAKEYAKVRLSIWQDDDFRALPPHAQHLYLVLLTAPDLSYCGRFDWRPNRIAPLAGGWSEVMVRQSAEVLTDRLFLVLDDATEEGLIRSYIRNDEILKQPKLSVSMANAYAAMSSNTLRGVVVHEVSRLQVEHPDLGCWKNSRIADLLSRKAVDPASLRGSVAPVVGGGFTQTVAPVVAPGLGQTQGKVSGLPSTATATATRNEEQLQAPRTRGTRLADDWNPTAEDLVWASEKAPGVNHIRETEKFRNYWQAKSGKDATKVDWSKTWRNWLLTALERMPQRKAPVRVPGQPLYVGD